jgi:alpha-beta hydrolase superfamily lysophospholipase
MQHTQGSYYGYGGIKLFRKDWLPDTAPRAELLIVHGFGEHCGRYMNVVNALVPQEYAIHSFDLRGHGQSEGRRGHVNHWSEYEEDVRVLVQQVHEQTPDLPLFLLGHSLGGLIVLTYGLRYPNDVKGIISSSPALAPPAIAPVLLSISRLLSHIWPTFSMATGLAASGISRIPEVVTAYRNDPQVHDIGSARLGAEMARAQHQVLTHAADWQLPLLEIQGSADRIIPPGAGKTFYEKVAGTDKEIRIYTDAYHEPHNDLCAAQEMTDIAAWLNRHL